MAHELSIRNDGYTEMAYSGEMPWHGLGQKLDANAPIEQWLVAAGMEWSIKRAKVRYPVSADDASQAVFATDEDNHVLFRSDTKSRLAIVGSGFKVVQPAQTLEFFRYLVADAGFKLCTAGVLRGGQKFWAQATAGLRDNVLGGDVVDSKLLIATACDGSMNTIVKEVSECVVCANTLAMALGENRGKKLIKVSHRSQFDAQDVKAALGITVTHFEHFIKMARTLAAEKVSPGDVDHYLLDLLYPATALDSDEKLMAARSSTGYTKIKALFDGNGLGSGMAGRKGTTWGLVNAVTEYVDHHRGTKSTTRDTRLDWAWFGDGDKLKSDAMEKAMALVV